MDSAPIHNSITRGHCVVQGGCFCRMEYVNGYSLLQSIRYIAQAMASGLFQSQRPAPRRFRMINHPAEGPALI